jgi:hypothetical protein
MIQSKTAINGELGTITNCSYEDMNSITFIKVEGLNELVMLFDWTSNDLRKRIANAKPEGRRNRGRSKLKWEDAVDVTLKPLGKET